MSIFKVTNSCIACGICQDACTNDAISIDDKAFIDHERCTKCESCMEECPMDAIVEVE